jgi:ubiquinone/menaquinone biosynthesis C-methylase UbiE
MQLANGLRQLNLLARIYNWSVPLEREALRRAVDLADVQPHERIIDVATGTGALLKELASRRAHSARVVGIDRSRVMLLGARGLPRARQVVVGDARELPFADTTFDVVFVSYLLHLMHDEDRSRVLAAVSRVLRPGGRIVTVTVDNRAAVPRWLLSLLPAWTGLHPLDPRPELQHAGLHVEQAEYTSIGWASLVVLATAMTEQPHSPAPPGQGSRLFKGR